MLIVGARRTPDLTLKRHIRFLGIALGLFVLNFLTGSLTNGGFPSDLLDDAISPLSVYAIYVSIMSLSPGAVAA